MNNTEKFTFTDENLRRAQELFTKYPTENKRSSILALLDLAQRQNGGWISRGAVEYVGELLDLPYIRVYEVASFYSMFNLQPVGKCLIEVCRTSSCWLCGAEDIINHLEQKLNIKVGETSSDGMFTLKAVECLGSCGTAPMMQVGADYHENLSIEKVDKLVDGFKQENKQSRYC